MTKIVTLVAALKASLPFVSKEEVRYYLNGTLFEHGLLVATDGKKMAAIKPDCYTNKDADPFIMPTDVIKQVVAVKGKGKTPLYVSIENGDQFWSVSVYQGDPTAEDYSLPPLATFAFKPIDGTYPDWRRVFPAVSALDNPAPACFDAAYLSEFKALGDCLKIFPNNAPTAPMIIRAKMPSIFEAVGVLMPMRSDDVSDPVPSWLGLKGE